MIWIFKVLLVYMLLMLPLMFCNKNRKQVKIDVKWSGECLVIVFGRTDLYQQQTARIGSR